MTFLLISSAPNWTDILGAIAGLSTVVIAAVAGRLAWGQLNEMKLARLTALMTDLSRRWDEPLLTGSRGALAQLRVAQLEQLVRKVYDRDAATEDERKTYFQLEALPNFLESIGIMQRRGLSLKVIDEHWGGAIVTVWESWSSSADFLRDRLKTKTIYKNLENLANAIAQHRGIELRQATPATRDEPTDQGTPRQD